MADLILRDAFFEGASRMTVHRTFRADRSSGSQLHEMQLFGIEWPTLAHSLAQRFNRCDVFGMLPRQAEIEARFVGHMHTIAAVYRRSSRALLGCARPEPQHTPEPNAQWDAEEGDERSPNIETARRR